jgi:predicted RNA-binding protein YlqC (UPF0109 family)
MTDDMQDKEFVEYVLKTVVDNPDDVHVDRTIDEMGVLLSVSVNPDDMGKVIGKSGQTAKAIRTLLKVVGAKHDARVNMKIVEPEDGNGGGGQAAPAADAGSAGGAVPQPGTTDAADDVPADETNVGEAVAAQHETDAAMPQPEVDNSAVDEATGNPAPQEPRSASEPPVESTPAASEEQRDQALHEKSPLDEL